MSKLFVWDFHGTMETGNDEAVREYTNTILKKHGYARRLTVSEAARLTGRRWWEYFSHLLSDEPKSTWLGLENACIDMVAERPEIVVKYIKPNDGVHEVLQKIKEAGHDQIIISNSHPEAMRMFLDTIRIGYFFPNDWAIGIASKNSVKTKKQTLDDFVSGKTYSTVVAIGDNDFDMIGTANYLYAHDGRDHKACDVPHYKIRTLNGILREI
jgi:phosphoglycolate phosphatase-like HAD superfamily hydrolase